MLEKESSFVRKQSVRHESLELEFGEIRGIPFGNLALREISLSRGNQPLLLLVRDTTMIIY